jgi:hypothetical protein
MASRAATYSGRLDRARGTPATERDRRADPIRAGLVGSQLFVLVWSVLRVAACRTTGLDVEGVLAALIAGGVLVALLVGSVSWWVGGEAD